MLTAGLLALARRPPQAVKVDDFDRAGILEAYLATYAVGVWSD
jgi:hypothetical protein